LGVLSHEVKKIKEYSKMATDSIFCSKHYSREKRDFAQRTYEENTFGYTLIALKALGLLDMRARPVPGCEGCFLDDPYTTKVIANALDGYCNAVIEEPSLLYSFNDADAYATFIYNCANTVTKDALRFVQGYPRFPDFTICTPITLYPAALGEEDITDSHATLFVFRFHWRERRMEWDAYETHGTGADWFQNSIIACGAVANRVVDNIAKTQVDPMAIMQMRHHDPIVEKRDTVGLQSLDMTSIVGNDMRVDSGGDIGWLVTQTQKRESYLRANAKITKNIGGPGGMCSVFAAIMMTLCALFIDKAPIDLELDMFNLFRYSRSRNIALEKGDVATYNAMVAEMAASPPSEEALAIMLHGTSNLVIAFSQTVIGQINKSKKRYVECCTVRGSSDWIDANGTIHPMKPRV
jgi:hypothetical protein